MGAQGTAVALLTTGQVAEWGQPSRQQLARSHAFALLANNAPVEEVQEAVTAEVREALPIALRGWEGEAANGFDSAAGMDTLAVELGKYIRLTGTQMGHDARQEWIEGATAELAEFPLSLVLPAVAAARRIEPWPNKLVPVVCEKIAERAARLEAEGDRLLRLSALT